KTAKSFTPATIVSGGTSQLRITISGNAPEVSFRDGFPAGMTWVAGTPVLTTCGPVTIDADSLLVSRGSGAKGCFVEVTMTATAAETVTLTNATSRIGYTLCPDGCSRYSTGGAEATLTVVAIPVPPQITSPCPPAGRVADPYQFDVVATGQPAPALSATGLPPGLSLAPGGRVSGTPTQAGSFAIVFTAANGNPPDAVQRCTIVIAANDLPPSIVSACPPAGTVGTAYAFGVNANGRPTPALSATGLPPGLTLGAGGALDGTPTQGGDFAVAFTAKNGVAPDAVQRCTITIRRTTTSMTLSVSPVPAVSGQTVTAIATVAGSGPVPQGSVQLCVVDPGYACPPPVGAPGTAPTRPLLTAALDAKGVARFTLTGLRIDSYLVSALYGGDAAHDGAPAGPVDAFVIKGALLVAPKVALVAPASAGPGETIAAHVTVAPVEPGVVPTGIVTLTSGGRALASASLFGGGAKVALAMPAAGTLEFTAEYAGDGAFPPAVSAPVAVTVQAKAGVGGESIPTLSDAALLFAALALAALGAFRLRRRPR
ncbi:MAG: IPTL-CTERM sorting domain-containing protein, partial [Betaproteobacteria bacterium]